MGHYARESSTRRPNADFVIKRATALVELVNVPDTFVSRTPYYVVNNTKQIKPFLLLVEGNVAAPEVEVKEEVDMANGEDKDDPADIVVAVKVETVKMERKRSNHLFQHDPALLLKPKYFNGPLAVVSTSLTFF